MLSQSQLSPCFPAGAEAGATAGDGVEAESGTLGTGPEARAEAGSGAGWRSLPAFPWELAWVSAMPPRTFLHALP